MFVQFCIGRHRSVWEAKDQKGMEDVFISALCSVDIHFLLRVSTERWLKHLGDKQLWKRSMLGFPYGLYITPRKWQMMPLNFYSQCYTITYGTSYSCRETFVTLLHLCTINTHTQKNVGTILTLLIFWKTADNTHSHTQKQYVCTTSSQTATGYTMKCLVLKPSLSLSWKHFLRRQRSYWYWSVASALPKLVSWWMAVPDLAN